MSVEAISWALNLAPTPIDPSGKPNTACAFVLVGLANHAGPDGTGAFPSAATLMRYTRLSERTVRTALDRLEADGLIRPGDPEFVKIKIKRGDRRPQSWDLALGRLRDDFSDAELETLERQFPGLSDRVAKARAAKTKRGATDAGASNGVQLTQNGVQLTQENPERGATDTERGATVAPEPSFDPSILEPSSEPSVGGASAPTAEPTPPTVPQLSGDGLFAEPEKKPKRVRREPPPATFEVTPDLQQWARENEVTVNLFDETEQFLDHHRAKGTTNLDWVAAWRTWMRNSKKFSGAASRTGYGKPRTRVHIDNVPQAERDYAAAAFGETPKTGASW